jgi:hypothetical protein
MVHNTSKAPFAASWRSPAAAGTTPDRQSVALASLVDSLPGELMP